MRAFLLVLAFLLALPTTATAQEGVRVLFVPGGSVPQRVRRTVERLISNNNVLVSYDTYARAAAQESLYPSARRALRMIAVQQGADVVVVASYGGHYRRRVLRLRYLNGTTGELMTSGNHGLRGQHLRAASQHSILRDLASAAGQSPSTPPVASTTEEPAESNGDATDDGGLPPVLDWEAEEAAAGEGGGDGTEGSDEGGSDESGEDSPDEDRQWGFEVALGAGVAHRTNTIPAEGREPGGLSTLPFPAIQAQVLGYVRPDESSRYRLSLAARYTTSVGLIGKEDRPDGSTRTTDLRSHHLSVGIRHDIPLAPGEAPTMLVLETGWALRMLDAEVPISIPSYTLHGIYARVGLFFPIGDSPLSVGIVPEIGHAISTSEELNQLSAVDDGFIVGAEVHIRLQIIAEVAIHLLYREAHAFLGSETADDEMSDAERFGILRAEYIF